jgi:hypothetical protein
MTLNEIYTMFMSIDGMQNWKIAYSLNFIVPQNGIEMLGDNLKRTQILVNRHLMEGHSLLM